MVAPNIPDVTMTSADPALLLCWEEQVKQGKDCSLILNYQGCKITTTLQVSKQQEPVTPKLENMPQASSQAEKKVKRNKKKQLEKLLSYHKKLLTKKDFLQADSCCNIVSRAINTLNVTNVTTKPTL